MVQLYGTRPRVAACDMHPDYASSRAAEQSRLPLCRVQHHLAHIAACMAEHDITPPVLGVAWDGTGHGPDGGVWGGEFLLLTASSWQRVAHLRAFRLPGGEAAMREPRRAALGLLFAAYGDAAFAMTHLAPVADFSSAEHKVLRAMLTRGLNAPVTTSIGRLFGAFAALCGLRQRSSYEGQAASALQWAADGRATGRVYALPLVDTGDGPIIIDWEPALAALLADLRSDVSSGAISEALHNGLAAAIAAVALRIGERRVVLTGGCFQNVRLTEASVAALGAAGCAPAWHRRIPLNDGGIAAGQAIWAAWHSSEAQFPCA